MSLVRISRALRRDVDELTFESPVAYVYNPLAYAKASHELYLEKYGKGPKEVVLLGMNPGPFGMAQTGVPFGEVSFVSRWMGIRREVGKPPREHPKRRILGFDTVRSEVSGARLWGWAEERFGTADAFFKRFFVVNYCPLAFLEESGRNLTPDKLRAKERAPLLAVCDDALLAIVDELKPKHVVGVGTFAEKCAKRVLADRDIHIGCMLHPSPASPKANQGWAPQAEADLAKLGIEL